MLALKGIEVICVFDAQYMPGVQTYEEFNAQVVFRMRRQIYRALGGRANTPSTASVVTSDLNEQWTVFASLASFGHLPES